MFFSDMRYAVRRLSAKPGFTATSILTMSLGIGASVAIFAVIHGILLKPLPYPHPEQLVVLEHTAQVGRQEKISQARSLHFIYSEENRVFQDVAMVAYWSWTTGGTAHPEYVSGLGVSHRFLSVLGVHPTLGRDFTAADDDPHGERTVILSHGYWKSRFGGDPSILGQRILLDDNAYEVIGVMPASFEFMDRNVSLLMPLQVNRAEVLLVQFGYQGIWGIARLKPGLTLTEASSDMARMIPMAPERFPAGPGGRKTFFADARVTPQPQLLKDELVGDIGKTLWVLMGTVGIVLAIACANVANLLLVRANGRRQELAIRAALGAGWGRIARELLLESTLLGLGGGILGVLLAYLALEALLSSGLASLPRLHEISIDPAVLAFAVAISLGTGLLFGLIPVFQYARPRVASGLRFGGNRSLTGSREWKRARGVLVVVQLALALILLVGSGLMIRTFQALRNVDPGLTNPAELETVHTNIALAQVPDAEKVVRMQEEILRTIEGLPGVSAVAATHQLPLRGKKNSLIHVEDFPVAEGSAATARRIKTISPGFISTIGSRLIAGRDLTWTDVYNRAPVGMISENMARELWRDPQTACGKRIRISGGEWREIVGVVADLHDDGLDRPAPSIVYWPLLRKFGGTETLLRDPVFIARTPRAGSAQLRREIQQAVASVNPSLPVADFETLESVYEKSLARTSLTLILLGIAGGMALLLGIVGIYGVISYSVSQQTREVGIRIALGASLREVTASYVRTGLVMSGLGAVCGLGAAYSLARLMQSVLFEVSPSDPLTYVGAAAGLILAAILGSYLPARRAARVNPVEALRSE